MPALRVRRRSRVVIGNNSSDDETLSTGSSKLRGPEFILNSSLPSQEIDITDAKVQQPFQMHILFRNKKKCFAWFFLNV